ncbi:substrate-binding domain-containing protein [Herbiconiux daphne]|uniref:Substrate-binding domain-containing protein n=1 Tax=Herbiconiux daphne TaxID=2970914 RepID=A0ABT2H6Z6_9MICO|nr:substrate-binding domain-containing protein [Herbiconiux daphne]MCS5735718.1 substrate-binding domain-containing protein [Herbiconiux daphne]
MVSPELVVVMGGMTGPDERAIRGTHTRLLRTNGFISHEQAGSLQVEYLTAKGHRTLGYAYSVASAVELVARERHGGAARAASAFALPDLSVEKIDPRQPTTVARAVDRWTAPGSSVTAVCAHNDEIALMILECLYERGLRPGVDLSVIGVDDIPAARINLTTVRVDVDAWSRAVADGALSILLGNERPTLEGEYLEVVARSSA